MGGGAGAFRAQVPGPVARARAGAARRRQGRCGVSDVDPKKSAGGPAPEPVVITGAGMITCLGLDRETTWRAVREARCGTGPLTAMEQPLAEGKDGGQAPDLPADYEPGRPREVRYLRRALFDALRDAGFGFEEGGGIGSVPYAPERCGVLFGTTLHGMRAAGMFLRTGDYGPLRTFLATNVLRA